MKDDKTFVYNLLYSEPPEKVNGRELGRVGTDSQR